MHKTNTRPGISRRQFLEAMAVTGLSVTMTGAAPAFADQAATDKIAIIFTNDVHCRTLPDPEDGTEPQTKIGYAGVGTAIAQARAAYGQDNTVLVDCGDFAQGLSAGTLTKGTALVELMNQAGYSIATLGNHDFDFGIDQLQTLMGMADFDVVSCNITSVETSELFAKQAYVIRKMAGKKVAFLGIATPETLTKTSPKNLQDDKGNYIVSFAQDDTGKALCDCVQKSVDAARAEGADYVVALAHLGQYGITTCWRSDTVAAGTSGIDMFLDGHSHEEYVKTATNAKGESITIIQAGTQLSAAGRVVIDTTTGGITAELIKPYVAQDETMAAAVKEVEDSLSVIRNKELTTSDFDLFAYENDGFTWAVRTHETNLSDLATDAIRIRIGADIGLCNAGSIRNDIDAGTVTLGDALNVFPFSNTMAVARASGQTIADALEMGARNYPEPLGGLLHSSGLTYEVRTDIESTVVVDDSGTFVEIAGARRVQNIKVGDAAIEMDQTYTVTCNSYILIYGGDGYSMWKDADVITAEGPVDFQVFSDFLSENCADGIPVEYENAAGQGRLIYKSGPDPTPTPGGGNDSNSTTSSTSSTATKTASTGDSSTLMAAASVATAATAACALVACAQ